MQITQVIGCAYTYEVSRAVRDAFSKDRLDHSSHQGKSAFSYFRKVDCIEDLVQDGGTLTLRKHPETGALVDHWYEPELVLVLGDGHQIIGYALGNDLTASKIEFESPHKDYDPTYFGKVWKVSCGMGEIISADQIGTVDRLSIGMRIERGKESCDLTYNTSQRKRDFKDLPGMILEYRAELIRKYGGDLPESKKIQLDETGNLLPGTAIMTGTGIITPQKWYAQAGDRVTVYSPGFMPLTNRVGD